MNELQILYLSLAGTFILVALIQLLYPKISPRGVVLSVTFPEEAFVQEELKRILKRYRWRTLFFCVLTLALLFTFYTLKLGAGAITALTFPLIFINFVAVILTRRDLLRWKKEMNFKVKKQVQVVDTSLSVTKIKEKSLWLYLLPLAIVLGGVVYSLVAYDSFPDKIPMHMDFQGNITRYAEKSYWNVLFVPLTNLFVVGIIFVSNFFHLKIKQRIDPSAPKDSLHNLMIARKVWTVFFALMATFLVLPLTFLFIFMNRGDLKAVDIMVWLLLALMVPVILGIVVIGLKVGNTGEKLKIKEKIDEEASPVDEDKYWILGGSIYYNPNDPSIFVAKRVGIGSTVNAGTLVGKIIYGVLALVIIASILISIFVVK